MTDSFYVTTPIYYVNAKPHLGHAYTTLVADSLTRFKRQRKVASFFLTGTDEHGINIERAAKKRGVPVKQHVDEVVDQFKAAFARLGIEYDRWIRTTDDYHERAVQKLWQILDERGYIYKGHYEGWFCAGCNEFKDVEAGDKEPHCPIHLRPLERVAEESYFFKLSEFQKPLLEYYEKYPDSIQPEARRNEVISFVSGGLKDLSVSRASVKWGIPVPGDPQHTIYVWLDALSNYITALGWGSGKYDEFDKYWPALHLVGKDILRFHTVYWPAFLLAAGIALPRSVFVHGMLLREGQKMGKSTGNAIDLNILHKHFTNDMIRYLLLREVAFGQDGEVSYAAMIDRINADLANGLGNLASRTLTMVKNYFGGVPPRVDSGRYDEGVRQSIAAARERFEEEFERLNFSRALEALWAGIASVDKFITESEPWKLAKDPSARDRLEVVIATSYEALRQAIALVAPVLPDASREVWNQLGLAGDPLNFDPNESEWGEDLGDVKVGEVRAAFPKLDKEKVMAEIEKEHAEQETPPGQPAAEPVSHITIDDFVKVELRAATVLEAERVPKADKLLKLLVDLGEGKPRQILAGIAEHYAPEDVVGRKIVVVANLAPRKMRGLESNGMLLAASVGEEGRPVLATFLDDVPNGTRLK
jgi:methionyl-tRNA synthetase